MIPTMRDGSLLNTWKPRLFFSRNSALESKGNAASMTMISPRFVEPRGIFLRKSVVSDSVPRLSKSPPSPTCWYGGWPATAYVTGPTAGGKEAEETTASDRGSDRWSAPIRSNVSGRNCARAASRLRWMIAFPSGVTFPARRIRSWSRPPTKS